MKVRFNPLPVAVAVAAAWSLFLFLPRCAAANDSPADDAAKAAAAGPAQAFRQFQEAHMGCLWTVKIYPPGDNSGKVDPAAAAAAVFARIHELDLLLSDYRQDSELSRLNATAGTGASVPVSPDFWTFLDLSGRAAEESEGAFDITIGPASRLWRRSRRRGTLPSPPLLARAKEAIGWKGVRLDAENRSVELTKPGMQLDPGGIAKGWALDEAMRILRDKFGLTAVLIDAGGQVTVGDPPPGRTSWLVEILSYPGADPPRPPSVLPVRNTSVSTSGDAYQFVRIEGVKYSHIVDPATGLGLTNGMQVTAVSPSSTLADWLDTALCVMGPERGLAWLIRRHPEVPVRMTFQSPGSNPESRENDAWKSAFAPR